MKVIGSDYPMS